MSNADSAGVRSPSYPAMSLTDAVTAVGKIEAQYRGSKVDREIAAKIIGYSGLSGPANKALAALAQYGLVERAGKGEMRVTVRARAILHPDSASEKQRELRAAAFEPQLFRELQERWPDMVPPEEGVNSYLNRKGFNQTAIRPATKAYLNTLLAIEQGAVSESHRAEDLDDAGSHASTYPETPVQPQSAPSTAPIPIPASAITQHIIRQGLPELNQINMNIRGDKVHIDALLDFAGILDLEKKIAALKVLLEVVYQPNDTGTAETPN